VPQRIILNDRYKYVAALFDGDELYDLDADPFETRNLIRRPGYSPVRRELRSRLIRHLETSPDPDAPSLLLSLRMEKD